MAKRFTFADAKQKIKDLEAINVKLNDNIVTHSELKWLRVYKAWFIISIIGIVFASIHFYVT